MKHLVTAALLAMGMTAAADEFEQRGAHVHGKVTVNIAIDGNKLAATLEAPAINVIGFERAPKDATEKKMAADAEAWLKSGRNTFGVPTAAGCKLVSAAVTAPDWSKHEDHDHDHGGKDKHAHDEAHEHADYSAQMNYECANIAAIDAVELWLLKRLPGTEEATVNIVTPTVQTSATATLAAPRVALR
jgi:hypothetical protein